MGGVPLIRLLKWWTKEIELPVAQNKATHTAIRGTLRNIASTDRRAAMCLQGAENIRDYMEERNSRELGSLNDCAASES